MEDVVSCFKCDNGDEDMGELAMLIGVRLHKQHLHRFISNNLPLSISELLSVLLMTSSSQTKSFKFGLLE